MKIKIVLNREPVVVEYLSEITSRFEALGDMKTFINSYEREEFRTEDEIISLIKVEYIPAYWAIIPIGSVALITLFGWSAWYLIPLGFSALCAYIWSPLWFITMFKAGLQKKGYTGRFKARLGW
jgi:hypothetical protein